MTAPVVSIWLLQAALPAYRARLLEELGCRGTNIRVATGVQQFNPEVVGGTDRRVSAAGIYYVQNRYLARRRILWQSHVPAAARSADVTVLELNPRIVNTWTLAMRRRLASRPTVLWGHAWPRRGRGSWTGVLRRTQRRAGNVVLVYTETEATALLEEEQVPVFAAPNALYYQREIRPVPPDDRRGFIFVGRLSPQKRPELLLQAFARACGSLPPSCKLHLVGRGPEGDRLKRRIADLGLTQRVFMHGEIVDVEALRSIYQRSLAAVIPGYAGLSLTQAIGMGVPVMVADDEPHAPEIEGLRVDFNGEWFPARSPAALSRRLVQWFLRRDDWISRSADISRHCRRSYSIERMADGFAAAIRYAEECRR